MITNVEIVIDPADTRHVPHGIEHRVEIASENGARELDASIADRTHLNGVRMRAHAPELRAHARDEHVIDDVLTRASVEYACRETGSTVLEVARADASAVLEVVYGP